MKTTAWPSSISAFGKRLKFLILSRVSIGLRLPDSRMQCGENTDRNLVFGALART